MVATSSSSASVAGAVILTLLLLFGAAVSFGPLPTRDFCVADFTGPGNGGGGAYPCKDPSKISVDDFYFSGLDKPTNTSNPLGSGLVVVSSKEMPGLNAQNTMIARADFAGNGGFMPPHAHPKATEIGVVLEGSGLLVGFVSSFPSFINFNSTYNKGDVFAIPQGLVHYLYNTGKHNVAVLFGMNGEQVNYIPLTTTIFGAKPDLDPDYLASSFGLDKKIILDLQAKF